MFEAIVSGLALLAVATPISVMAAAIVLQPSRKDCFAASNSLFNGVTTHVKKTLKGSLFYTPKWGERKKIMEKEKIILGNGTVLSYDSIGFSGNTLVIGFIGGDAADLESKIRAAGQNNLEEIQQVDGEGNEQAVHELYDIFTAVNKKIGAVEQESGEKADLVEIVLTQETETEARLRHLESRMTSTEEVTDTLLMDALM